MAAAAAATAAGENIRRRSAGMVRGTRAVIWRRREFTATTAITARSVVRVGDDGAVRRWYRLRRLGDWQFNRLRPCFKPLFGPFLPAAKPTGLVETNSSFFFSDTSKECVTYTTHMTHYDSYESI